MYKTETALIVIDTQTGIFNKGVFKQKEVIANINSLIDVFHRKSLPVIFMRHTNSSSLAKDSDDWQIHGDIHTLVGDIFLNKVHSSSFKEKNLKVELDKLNIKSLIIAGLVTQGCVKAACKDAIPLGYDVTLVKDGHSNYSDNAEDLINEWNAALSSEGVKVLDTEDILKLL